MYLLWISSKCWFIHLVSFLHLVFLCLLVSVLESLEHAYLLLVSSLACFLSLTQYIGETPPSLKLDEMCMKFIFISICTYLCGGCPMYCWFSNSLVLMSLGTLFVCDDCSRNNWRCIGCSSHSQGRCCHHVLTIVKLGSSMNYYLPSIGIYYILSMLTR